MKIGVLTFHSAHNYGAVLQAYALKHWLENNKCDVSIINYSPAFLTEPYLPFSWKWFDTFNPIKIIHRLFVYVPLIYLKKKRYQCFQDFILKYLLNEDKTICEKIPNDFDVYLIGSDQVWNIEKTQHDMNYWGNFNHHGKIIAYAASGINADSPIFKSTKLQQMLSNFSSISVREKSAKELIHQVTNQYVVNVLDPTFLLNKQDWNDFSNVFPIESGKYVLLYQVREDERCSKVARCVANQLDAHVVEINAWIRNVTKILKYNNYSPIEFVNLIRYAQCVITSSFHGTALSIILNKPFYAVMLGNNGDNRIKELLDLFKLEDRGIIAGSQPKYTDINYEMVNPIIQMERQKSISFINDIIQ